MHVTVHAQDGSRVGCGILQPMEETDESWFDLLYATTAPLGDSTAVTGKVLTIASKATHSESILCYVGTAEGLEAGINSYLNDGTDCNVENGCGTHIHSGTSCENTTTQGGHWYNDTELETDPWLTSGYLETDNSGTAMYGSCVNVGFTPADAVDKPFIVHGSDGSRVACGMLQIGQDDGGDGMVTSDAYIHPKVMMRLGFVAAFAVAWR